MDREQVLSILRQHREALRQRFGVKHLALFGSAARDQLHDGSDIDLLVEFEGPPTLDGYLNLKDYLEALFCTAVDLATDEMVKPRLRRNIEKDLIRVA